MYQSDCDGDISDDSTNKQTMQRRKSYIMQHRNFKESLIKPETQVLFEQL